MLIDTTLREGNQRFGLYLSHKNRKKIVKMLSLLGIEEIEVGVAGRDDTLSGLMDYIHTLENRPRISIWSPLRMDCLVKAQQLKPDIINIGLPVSDLHLNKRLQTNRKAILRRLSELLKRTRRFKTLISIGLEDISRADHDFALHVALFAESMGAWRIRMSDSVGLFSPGEVLEVSKKFRKKLKVRLGFHAHNDMGMATANAISALDGGCHYADVSILGIGERSGIARLEEVAARLVLKHAGKYNMALIPKICTYVAGLSNTKIDEHRPIIGSRIFHIESGLHADGLYKDSRLFEPFDPDWTGHKRTVCLGGKSGINAVKGKLSQLLPKCDQHNLEDLTNLVRDTAGKIGRPISDKAFLEMLNDLEIHSSRVKTQNQV